jgi:hypothetical protein
MDPMRRILAALSLACLLSGLTGCCHYVAGICDCDIPGHSCCMPCSYHYLAPGAWVAPKPEAAPAPMPVDPAPKAPEKAPEKAGE